MKRKNEICPSRMNTFAFWKKAFLAMSFEVSQIGEKGEAWSGSDRDFNTIQRQRRTHLEIQ